MEGIEAAGVVLCCVVWCCVVLCCVVCPRCVLLQNGGKCKGTIAIACLRVSEATQGGGSLHEESFQKTSSCRLTNMLQLKWQVLQLSSFQSVSVDKNIVTP